MKLTAHFLNERHQAGNSALTPGRWLWVLVAVSVAMTGTVGWLHFLHRTAFEREATQLRQVRHARVELNRGYRIAVLATDPALPFDREEGLALIRQSIAAFSETLTDVAPSVQLTAGDFSRRADDLESALVRWRNDPSPANAAAMRIAFGRLDRQTALIDADNERELRELSASQSRVFAAALGGAGLLLAGCVGLMYVATRARARAEAARHANTQLFQTLFDRVPVALGFSAENGTNLIINESFTRLFGYVAADLPDLARWWLTAYPDPADRLQFSTSWQRAIAAASQNGGRIEPAEFRVTCKDGSVRLIEISGILIAGGILAVFRDMTTTRAAEQQAATARAEREQLLAAAENSRRILLSVVEDQKSAEIALRESEARYRSLVETSFDWVWEVDTQGRYTYASPRVAEILGYDPAEVLGRKPFDFMPREEAARVGAIFATIARERRPIVALENVNQHKNGRLVVAETNGVPVFAPDGTWIGYQGMDRDITQRRAAEQMLRLHGAALEAAANAVVILSARGTIEWINPAFTKLSGWTLEEAVGQSPRQLLDSGQHDEGFYREIDATNSAGKIWQGEIINKRKDGALRHEEMTITPITDSSGSITHFVAIKQDITERKVGEARARQAQRMESIGTLAGGIAHDLNNILSPMLMVAGLIKAQLPDPRDQDMVSIIEQGATRGANIIRQLLTFSRGLGGERVQVQSRHILREMANIVRETFPRDIEFQLDLAPNLDMIEADPTQVHQLVLNLCVNARDAMPEGGRLKLSATNQTVGPQERLLTDGVKPGRFIVIGVSDTGHGIPPEIKDRIFDPFFTTKPLGKGTGLGLSTVLGIVNSHGGFITVDSTPQSGTTFKVFLPSTATAASDDHETGPKIRLGESELVLVVDDEPDIRRALQLLLTARGYRVLTAVNGRDAIALYEQHREAIRVVVTDIMMPSMGGVTLTQFLHQANPRLVVIAMSGMSELPQREELTRLGVKRILQKPAPEGELLGAIEQALEQPGTPSA